MAVKAVPERYGSVTPYLVVVGVDKLIAFLGKAFGGECVERIAGPGGATRHA